MNLTQITPPWGLPGAVMFRSDNGLTVIYNVEEGRIHVSIAHPHRYPKWGEIRQVREQLVPPDVWLTIPYPPKSHWVNIHKHCFHLWEIKDELLLEIWRRDGEEAQRLGDNYPTESEEGDSAL